LASCVRGWSIEKEKLPKVTIGAESKGVNRASICRCGGTSRLGPEEAAEFETWLEVCVARGKTRRL
jgi:hypothetical protein